MTEGSANKTVDYLGGFQYEDENLSFFPTTSAPLSAGSEGYVKVTETGTVGKVFSYVYNHTDHLGNIRLRYTRDPEEPGKVRILEENSYYPFGLKHEGYNNEHEIILPPGHLIPYPPVKIMPITPFDTDPYQYKYNGKEHQGEFGLDWYDYGARNYDAALGRWMNVDPLAEANPNWTPYRYAFNNPLKYIDPTGMLEDIYINENGDYLGVDGASTKDVRVVSQETWDSVGGEEGAQTAEGTATLQNSENSSLLVGTDKHTQPGYQKGISISAETKRKIEDAGGKVGTPTLVNNSESSVFIRPESNVTQGPGATNSDGAYTPQEIKSGKSVYGMIDGVKTSKFSDAVFKLVDGNKVSIESGGNVNVTSYGGLYGFGGAMTIGGWSITEFPKLRSVPIGNTKLNKSPTSLGGFKRFGEY